MTTAQDTAAYDGTPHWRPRFPSDVDGIYKAAGITRKGPFPWFDFQGEEGLSGAEVLFKSLENRKDMWGVILRVNRVRNSAHVLAVPALGRWETFDWRRHALLSSAYSADLMASQLWRERGATTLRISPRPGELPDTELEVARGRGLQVKPIDLAYALCYVGAWWPIGRRGSVGLQFLAQGAEDANLRAAINEVDIVTYQSSGKKVR